MYRIVSVFGMILSGMVLPFFFEYMCKYVQSCSSYCNFFFVCVCAYVYVGMCVCVCSRIFLCEDA